MKVRKMNNFLFYRTPLLFKILFVLTFFLFSVRVSFAGTAECSGGSYCDPTWSSLECQSAGDFTCDCGDRAASCSPNGSWTCSHAYNGSSISCDGGSSCQCAEDDGPIYTQAAYYTNSYTQAAYYTNSYTQSSYYSQSVYGPGYSESSYYTQAAYYSQSAYYSQASYGPGYTQASYSGPGYTQASYVYSQASYAPVTHLLEVFKTSGGSVKSVGNNGISCGTDCTENYVTNTNVTLRATPNSSYWKFNGWVTVPSGMCSGTGDCTFTMNGAKKVTGRFLPRLFMYKEF